MSEPVRSAARIRVLPDHVANQIAAGEVVERPASVVKELVENALDAQAQTVRVSIERGGKKRVRVADDGHGMDREDALACLDRHATSKIRDAGDLRQILTLGFRGEALPSIAAVSRMVIETARAHEPSGTRLRILAGQIQSVEDAARRPGTTVDVHNLFLNTPVRARFLRSSSVETRAVSEVLHSLSLTNLTARFALEVNGRTVLDVPGDRDLATRIGQIWSQAETAGLFPVSGQANDLRLSGVVQRPDRARPGFRRVHLFVNGRPFRDPGVLAAADRGYRTTIQETARPWLFLYLTVPPEAVDVNVHPSKDEVRFRDPDAVGQFVEATVRHSLAGVDSAATWSPSVPGSAPRAVNLVREGNDDVWIPPDSGKPADARPPAGDPGETADARPPNGDPGKPTDSPADARPPSGDPGKPADSPADARPPNGDPGEPDLQLRFPSDGDDAAPGTRADVFSPEAPKPALLQIHNSFILAETRHGLIIVDQHAAHERILYEQIIARFEHGPTEGQRLLFPFTLRLTRQEIGVVRSVSKLLAQLGFEIEPFGPDALRVQAVPAPHRYFDPERCIREMIDELFRGSELMRSARNQNERVAMSFACKGAVKAGQKLSTEEMQELFDQLFATEIPYHDVHGRPTVVRLGLTELRRKFGRT